MCHELEVFVSMAEKNTIRAQFPALCWPQAWFHPSLLGSFPKAGVLPRVPARSPGFSVLSHILSSTLAASVSPDSQPLTEVIGHGLSFPS